MVSHNDVANAFKDGRKLTGSRMFTDGKVVYSYGYHFPIAVKLKEYYLFNTSKYSSSTSSHQSYIRRVIDEASIIECNTNEIKRAIDYPEEPIILTKIKPYSNVDDCLERIKEIFKEKGLKRFPIKKIKEQIENWELVKSI